MKAAVLIVDMQNEFLAEGGSHYFPVSRSIIPNVKLLVDNARKNGLKIVYTMDTQTKDYRSRDIVRSGEHCMKGTWGWQIVDELRPHADDTIVEKREYSSFFGTRLQQILCEMGVESLIVAGFSTACCVRATIQDAFQLGYEVFVPENCVSASSDTDQQVNLRNINSYFGRVVPFDKLPLK
jgi:ureidoacrylate peracid hydrolase